MSILQTVNHWYQTKWGLLLVGCAELLLAYSVGLRAIDTGSLWQYALAFSCLIGSLRDFLKLVKVTVAIGK